jgi:hypothetical protein
MFGTIIQQPLSLCSTEGGPQTTLASEPTEPVCSDYDTFLLCSLEITGPRFGSLDGKRESFVGGRPEKLQTYLKLRMMDVRSVHPPATLRDPTIIYVYSSDSIIRLHL